MRKQGPIRRGLSIKRWGQRLAQHLRLWVPAFAGTTMPYDKGASPRAELFREYKNLACTGDIGPAAVELGDQRFQRIAVHRPIERGLIGELVTGLMQGGIVHAPEPPRLLDAECFCGVGQMCRCPGRPTSLTPSIY